MGYSTFARRRVGVFCHDSRSREAIGRRRLPTACPIDQVDERLPREFGYCGIRVAEEGHQYAQPRQFTRFNADQDGFGHREPH